MSERQNFSSQKMTTWHSAALRKDWCYRELQCSVQLRSILTLSGPMFPTYVNYLISLLRKSMRLLVSMVVYGLINSNT